MPRRPAAGCRHRGGSDRNRSGASNSLTLECPGARHDSTQPTPIIATGPRPTAYTWRSPACSISNTTSCFRASTMARTWATIRSIPARSRPRSRGGSSGCRRSPCRCASSPAVAEFRRRRRCRGAPGRAHGAFAVAGVRHTERQRSRPAGRSAWGPGYAARQPASGRARGACAGSARPPGLLGRIRGAGQDAGPGTDFDAVAEGYVSVTPLHFDLTRHSALPESRALAET